MSVATATSLFEPVTVAGLDLQTPFVMAPMTRQWAIDGHPHPNTADYYARRAAGGIGLVVTEGIPVDDPSAHHGRDVPRLDPGTVDTWRTVAAATHRAGGRILAQLWHLGGERAPGTDLDTVTPSGLAPSGRPYGRALTQADIERVTAAFVRSARTAQQAGFDGVEIHGAHGYLIHEFLWPATNRRTDSWGGTDRSRFAAGIVRAIREATGPSFRIAFRFSQFAERDYTARIAESPTELEHLLAPIVSAGVDLLHASQRRFWEPTFPRHRPTWNLAGWATHLTGLPTVTVGSVGLTSAAVLDERSPSSLRALAERRAAGEFALIAVGRPLLRTADWVERAGSGRLVAGHDYTKLDELLLT